ncbi:LysR substrate-binding domain-containing protein [Vibrio salinus]|uniref:LysR substrate-binding domain-containing protein n=1 Tax=Vibrio salinus TaxID=2899784 RepID=UPI001E4AD369|nr:LysR substrate-binding domain-containing protein [Vibrio salinus]MCE0495880.1 LysR substrate-binding domain-containing protein [Vibrio salinus]
MHVKLQQLKYLKAISDNNLNVSAASEALFTTQPGVSKQVLLLEKELGVRIFERHGKHLQRITDVGEKILSEVEKMLRLEQKIKAIAKEHVDPGTGVFNIFTTHTIARYLLPASVSVFTKRHPKINFNLHPTLPSQAKGGISRGYSDFSIVAHDVGADSDLIILPAYLWTLGLVVPEDHPLASIEKPTLEDISQYPLLTYEQGASGRERIDETFRNAGLALNYFMTAMDADVIKRYVELGFGIGIISSLAAKDIEHMKLKYIDINHLLEPCQAWICFSKDVILQNYMYDFLGSFSPHLTKTLMEEVLMNSNSNRVEAIFKDIKLPVY